MGEAEVFRFAVLAWVLLAVVAAGVAGPRPAQAQSAGEGSTALMLVMDASGSMNATVGTGGGSKLDAAKTALRAVVENLPDGVPVGLTVYGHRVSNDAPKAQGCADIQTVVPVGPLDRKQMRKQIDAFAASGYTPIGESLRQSADAMPEAATRTIVLVSDGIDTCAPPAPCDVARELAGKAIDLTVQTVGFQVDDETRRQLSCIADTTGGMYRDVTDAKSLADGLVAVTARAVRDYTPTGQQVAGGASYQEAPVLTPGTYNDTILANEQLWYAVQLAEGQRLKASTTLVIGDGDFGGVGSFYEIQLLDPLFEEMCCGDERGYEINIGYGSGGARTVTVAARTDSVGEADSDAEEPGTYYVRLSADGNGAGEYPVELNLTVEGDAPEAAATPSTTPSSASSAPSVSESTPPAIAADTAASDSGGNGLLLVVVIVLGLLVVGLAAGMITLWRRQNANAGPASEDPSATPPPPPPPEE